MPIRSELEYSVNGHRYKSYDIVKLILQDALYFRWLQRPIRVLDLTYGKGRWWRKARRMLQLLIGIDMHDWEKEVEPDVFLVQDARKLNAVREIVEVYEPNLIAVDPPWSYENRGVFTVPEGMEALYHQPVRSRELILAAKELAAEFELPLLYRYKTRVPCRKELIYVQAKMRIKGRPATIHYALCTP